MPIGRMRRRWAVAAFSLGALLAVPLYFAFVERAHPYSHAYLYPDTALAREPVGKVTAWRFAERAGSLTLVLSRGLPHSTVSTRHGWHEQISIEIPAPPPVGRAELSELHARAGFTSYRGQRFWRVGEGGVRGHLNVLSVGADWIEAEYDRAVDACCGFGDSASEDRHQVLFRGRATFRHAERPDRAATAARGELSPK